MKIFIMGFFLFVVDANLVCTQSITAHTHQYKVTSTHLHICRYSKLNVRS